MEEKAKMKKIAGVAEPPVPTKVDVVFTSLPHRVLTLATSLLMHCHVLAQLLFCTYVLVPL